MAKTLTMPRFVVLRHEMPPQQPRASHWDLMLEHDGSLRTWAIEQALDHAEQPIVALVLPDHRLAYLDYEGPVSGDRGSVTRVDRGSYELLEETTDALRVELRGGRFAGAVTITRSPADAHSRLVSFVAAPTRD